MSRRLVIPRSALPRLPPVLVPRWYHQRSARAAMTARRMPGAMNRPMSRVGVASGGAQQVGVEEGVGGLVGGPGAGAGEDGGAVPAEPDGVGDGYGDGDGAEDQFEQEVGRGVRSPS
jgi:hypothetical protein